MISVIVPTLNAERRLARALTSLVPATIAGLVREVIVVDGGSSDNSVKIADAMGARIVLEKASRGRQLAAGAAVARAPWLLFLHADTAIDEHWYEEAYSFIRAVEPEERDRAAVFRFALDDRALAARAVESLVKLRCTLFALPYGDQGLMISRDHYERIGGFGDMPLMEDVDIVRRIGRKGLATLRARAVTSARRYKEGGYFVRPLRNLMLLSLYFLRVPPEKLAKLYG